MEGHFESDDADLTFIMDIGETVVCDFCNGDFTKSDDTVGVLIGTYAVCPRCAGKVLMKHPEEIDAACPAGMRFRDWVLALRNGDNTIKITAVR